MKNILPILFTGLFALAINAQAPEITGDLMLCPDTSGTAYITTDVAYDSYQWYWKYWFTSDPFVAVPNADGPSFTYDWETYDQALLKVVVTLDGQTYESNTLQIDSYAWVGLTVGFENSPNVSINPENGNVMLCAGTSFTIQVYMPYTEVQWYRDGSPIPGANAMELHVNEPGSYHVVAAPGFCPNSVSSTAGLPIVVEIDSDCNLGTDTPQFDLLSVYPNPASSQLHFEAQYPISSMALINLAGQRVWSVQPASFSGTIDLSLLASGMYILEAHSEANVQRLKIVKN